MPIPTTYCHHAELHAEVAAAVALALAPAALSATPLSLPEKLLAVCAGLARYGRNTIAYVDGCGQLLRARGLRVRSGAGRRPLDRSSSPRALWHLRGLPAGLPRRGHR